MNSVRMVRPAQHAPTQGSGLELASRSTRALVLARIEALFLAHGHRRQRGSPSDGVTALEHALQTAQLAEWAHADTELVVASLLHDLGHFVDAEPALVAMGSGHESRVLPMLSLAFSPAVTAPIALHVAARRYLVTRDASYVQRLSPVAAQAVQRQGGMTRAECDAFDALPYAGDAIQLRLWDDLARYPGKSTPPLQHYLRLLESLLRV